ncbi:hypothetical protein F5Y00DRAFT_159364 [Daldinia vernicosa]|uniref:uncharacterized protein n=1 Tax=Daldinia vernicosa TaxID=114800 RepID=UPI0020074ED5|nr:uncharacterized protein F5Y00DRAFT_159364 [Daldinia vernicosa]KAI0845913.1 hypothetical protein F5Y00DRAFT_159364 [Daldinia vernicosa]
MRSFVTLLAAAASLQGGSAAPFGNQQQPPTTISHGGFPHPTGDFPRPPGFLHPSGDWHHHDGYASPTGKFPWQFGSPHPTPRVKRQNEGQESDHKEPWGFPHPTGHYHHHPSGGFPHPTGRPETSNIFLRRDADHVHPPPDGFAHPSGRHPHPTGGFPQPTGGPNHHHHPPGDKQDHGDGNWQGNHEKRDEGFHRPASISWPSGITSHLHPHPTTGAQPGHHVQQPEGEPKREREILQEIPRVVQDAN